MDPERERALVARAAVEGSAFAELYDFYLPRIHGYLARRLGDRSVVEDLTAMTFERALVALRRGTFRNEAFGGWLYRVAANALVDHVRRRRLDIPLGMRAGDASGHHRDAGDDDTADERAVAAFAAAIDRDALRSGLLALPGHHRRAIVARFLDGLEGDALAGALDCSRATAAVRVHRALRALREVLAEEAIDAA